jgi:Holliday junction resolvasome RuvABC endonuclease subunit
MKYVDLPHANAALGIFPSTEGFGWIVFDGPLSPVRWSVSAIATTRRKAHEKNARCLERIEEIVKQWTPPVIVLEQFEGGRTRRAERIKKLCRSVVALAAVNGIEVKIISRKQIESCFTSAPARTRYQVATIVASYIKEIAVRLPEKRKFWKSENSEMALFNAAVLLIVHYANPRQPL